MPLKQKLKNSPALRPSSPAEKSFLREYGEALFIALLLALFIRAFVAQAFTIPSGSMIPTLLVGDYILVNKFGYGIRNPFSNKIWVPIGTPQRGDVVVFIFPEDPTKDYIKRVIGLPGDQVLIRNKKVFINGKPLETPQAVYSDPSIFPAPTRPTDPPRDNFGPVTVPKDSLFVMGDNRDYSYDSRFWGFVPQDNLRGKAFIIYFSWAGKKGEPMYQALLGAFGGLATNFSWDSKRFQLRWQRIGKIIH